MQQIYKLLMFTATYESSEFNISNFSRKDIFFLYRKFEQTIIRKQYLEN